MSNEIKQEPSSSGANENQEMVPKKEFNRLKRKLEETEPKLLGCKRRLEEVEPELAEYKRKYEEAQEEMLLDKEMVKLLRTLLEENEAKLEKKRKKMKQLVAAADIKFRPTRARIALTLPNFVSKFSARKQFAATSSDPVVVAGFQWKLRAYQYKKWLYICIDTFPAHPYNGQFEFEVDCSFRLLNNASICKDIHKEVAAMKIEKGRILELNSEKEFTASENSGSARIPKFALIKDLRDPENGFLHADGSIRVEADLLLKTGTLDHLLVDVDEEDVDTKEVKSGGNEEN